MVMAKISVIVPVYKVEAYLHRCVESIFAQTFRDYELILVDDGSPDRCGEICEEFARKDSRVVVLHRENGGLSAARNTGIDWAMENSDSQWLAFVDSDDWVAPGYLELLYKAVSETGCRLAACGLKWTSGEPLPPLGEVTIQTLGASEYYCSQTIHGGITATAWNKLYHKSLFFSLRYPQGKLHEDEFTTYRAVFLAEQVAVVDVPLYAYFQNDSGITHSPWTPRRMDALEATENQIAFSREIGDQAFLQKALKDYIHNVLRQMGQAEKDPVYHSYVAVLRRKLRWGLRQCRKAGMFRVISTFTWAYEPAYPCKPLWWLVGKWEAWRNEK